MSEVTRRQFNHAFATVSGGFLASSATSVFAKGKGKAGHVVIIGGGVGGIAVAQFIKKKVSKINVTIIEPRKSYTSCFFSNHYVGGFRSLESLGHSYSGIRSDGVKFVHDYAVKVDQDKKQVTLHGGEQLSYDRLVLSPGVSLDYDGIEGYSPEAAKVMPHAWQFGEQSKVLRNNLLDMEDGGLVSVVIGKGAEHGRSPYAAYERASLIAHYLKSYKPASKLIIFDAKPKFEFQELYLESWKKYYPGLLEWVSSDTTNGGIQRLDHNTKTLYDGNGQEIKSSVTTVIPKQRAGKIAFSAGVVVNGWCPVEPDSFRSIIHDDIYVLGDSAQNGIMPRTASAAYSQAKVVGNSIIADLANKKRFPARFTNTCWALLSTNDAIKFGSSFKAGKEKVELTGSFTSKVGEDGAVRQKTYREAQGWYKNLSSELFSKGSA